MMLQDITRESARPAVLDVRQRLLSRPTDAGEHDHRAFGVRIASASAGEERMHYHRTSAGTTDWAPNKPGHRHRLPDGTWTQPSTERWTNHEVTRL